MTTKDALYERAALWHQEQGRDDFDWDGFAQWLAADPEHRACYDEIALLDDEIDRRRPALRELISEPRPRDEHRRWRLPTLGAAAAAMVAVAALSLPLLRSHEPAAATTYHAAAGEIRSISLPGGTTATLAPGSTLVADADMPRRVRLTGTAFFDVRHDGAAPFTVESAGFSIRDLGTRFDVAAERGVLRVAVQAGSVSVGSATLAQPVVLGAGKALLADPASGLVEVTVRAADAVGGWRRGRLVYDQAPLGLVAADVSRYAGRRVEVDQALAHRRFSGVITVQPGVSAVDTLQQLTGLDARVEGSTVRLVRGAGD